MKYWDSAQRDRIAARNSEFPLPPCFYYWLQGIRDYGAISCPSFIIFREAVPKLSLNKTIDTIKHINIDTEMVP
jgi:hypothetical protein